MVNTDNIISIIINSINDALKQDTEINIDKNRNNRKSSHGKDVDDFEDKVENAYVAYYKNTSF